MTNLASLFEELASVLLQIVVRSDWVLQLFPYNDPWTLEEGNEEMEVMAMQQAQGDGGDGHAASPRRWR